MTGLKSISRMSMQKSAHSSGPVRFASLLGSAPPTLQRQQRSSAETTCLTC